MHGNKVCVCVSYCVFLSRLNHHNFADLNPGLFPSMWCFLERACVVCVCVVRLCGGQTAADIAR